MFRVEIVYGSHPCPCQHGRRPKHPNSGFHRARRMLRRSTRDDLGCTREDRQSCGCKHRSVQAAPSSPPGSIPNARTISLHILTMACSRRLNTLLTPIIDRRRSRPDRMSGANASQEPPGPSAMDRPDAISRALIQRLRRCQRIEPATFIGPARYVRPRQGLRETPRRWIERPSAAISCMTRLSGHAPNVIDISGVTNSHAARSRCSDRCA